MKVTLRTSGVEISTGRAPKEQRCGLACEIAKQRRTWGELNPVTRSVPSGKAYSRKKEKQRLLRAGGTCSATTEAEIGKEFRNGFDAGLSLCV